MRDLRKYWQEVRALERELPEFVWLVALDRASAPVVEVHASQAAKLLHVGSHRRATEEEMAAHQTAVESERRRAFESDLRRKGIAVVPVPSSPKRKK
jgi:hypothetical protein